MRTPCSVHVLIYCPKSLPMKRHICRIIRQLAPSGIFLHGNVVEIKIVPTCQASIWTCDCITSSTNMHNLNPELYSYSFHRNYCFQVLKRQWLITFVGSNSIHTRFNAFQVRFLFSSYVPVLMIQFHISVCHAVCSLSLCIDQCKEKPKRWNRIDDDLFHFNIWFSYCLL